VHALVSRTDWVHDEQSHISCPAHMEAHMDAVNIITGKIVEILTENIIVILIFCEALYRVATGIVCNLIE